MLEKRGGGREEKRKETRLRLVLSGHCFINSRNPPEIIKEGKKKVSKNKIK